MSHIQQINYARKATRPPFPFTNFQVNRSKIQRTRLITRLSIRTHSMKAPSSGTHQKSIKKSTRLTRLRTRPKTGYERYPGQKTKKDRHVLLRT